MPWVIERGGTYHSEGGWRTSAAAAKRFDKPEDAEDARDELLANTLAGLPGELHVRELEK